MEICILEICRLLLILEKHFDVLLLSLMLKRVTKYLLLEFIGSSKKKANLKIQHAFVKSVDVVLFLENVVGFEVLLLLLLMLKPVTKYLLLKVTGSSKVTN